MSFFDSKEEVISIELTQYGKELFAKGIFDPVYYAFYDDDIIYDMKYCNVTESQNDIETRILEESIYNKIFYSFDDKIKRTKKYTDYNINPYDDLKPIGSSDSLTQYIPAWNITVLSGATISNVVQTASINTGVGTTKSFKIPQINLNPIFVSLSGSIQDLEINSENILFEIIEKNVTDSKENFEIELYEVVTGANNNQQLNLLPFGPQPIYIKDNILLDEPIIPDVDANNSPEYADYYFSIDTDKQINFNFLNNNRRLDKKVYDRKITEER